MLTDSDKSWHLSWSSKAAKSKEFAELLDVMLEGTVGWTAYMSEIMVEDDKEDGKISPKQAIYTYRQARG